MLLLTSCARSPGAVWGENPVNPAFQPALQPAFIEANPGDTGILATPYSPSIDRYIDEYIDKYKEAPPSSGYYNYNGYYAPDYYASHYGYYVECPYYEATPRPMVALTFDDGPGPFTDYLLDILDEHGGRVTFCVLGNRVEPWSQTILRMIESGNEVLGHSWNHRHFGRLNEAAVIEQIFNTSAAIEAVTGFPPAPIFRAPYGFVNSMVRRVSREIGYSILNWSLDPEDWRYRDADIIYNFIMSRAIHGSIILLHDIHPTTVEAMERVIPGLQEAGFQLVTISELFEYLYGPLEPGREYRGIR